MQGICISGRYAAPEKDGMAGALPDLQRYAGEEGCSRLFADYFPMAVRVGMKILHNPADAEEAAIDTIYSLWRYISEGRLHLDGYRDGVRLLGKHNRR